MIIGTVKFFDTDKGFGFIGPDAGGKDTFVHISAVQASDMETLRAGERVGYDIVIDRRGKEIASNLKPMGEL
tara:strand:+ start:361 stop:576 length:216 start_codon:yes stop_codon:yes gene_type:complete